MQYNYQGAPGTDFGTIYGGGQPFIAADPTLKWVVNNPTTRYGVVSTATDAQVAANPRSFYPVTCKVGADGLFICSTTFNSSFNTMFSCGAYMYFGMENWVQAGCIQVKFKLVNTTYA